MRLVETEPHASKPAKTEMARRRDQRFKGFPTEGTATSSEVMEFLRIGRDALESRIERGELAPWREGNEFRFDWAAVRKYRDEKMEEARRRADSLRAPA
jgi:hypothetical protein